MTDETWAWFEENVYYQGELCAEFESGSTLTGTATVTITNNGMMEIRLPLSCPFSQGGCTKVTVTVESGILSCTEADMIHVEPIGSILRIYLLRCLFDTEPQQPAKYWVLPLYNYAGNFNQPHPPLGSHPLRLNPPQKNPIVAGTTNVLTQISVPDQLTTFHYNGGRAFIEPLSDYDARLKNIEFSIPRAITAIMVGEVGTNSIDAADVENWFPINYLLLLSLATGVEVGAPWIEFRAANGALVRRRHVAFERPVYGMGVDVISRGDEIGTLLTCAAQSGILLEIPFRVVLRNMVKAGQYSTSLDDRLAYLVRAIDGLIGDDKPMSGSQLSRLNSTQKTAVQDIIDRAVNELKKLAQTAGTSENEQRVIKRISDRVPGCYDVPFGDKFEKLLSMYGLHDYQIVNVYLQAHPLPRNANSFSKALSYLRAGTIHNGYLDIGGKLDYATAEMVFNHLYDIMVRIILKKLGYTGVYQTWMGGVGCPLDWVQPSTSPEALGYK